jgi:hypothetical protein
MTTVTDPTLLDKTRRLSKNPAELDSFLKQLSKTADDNAIDRVISLYKKTIKKVELELWQGQPDTEKVARYQDEFKVLEKLYQLKTSDERHHFKIVIPVADRPQHLKQCLNSLLTLCHSYGYGGTSDDQSYQKISVLIADDSQDNDNIEANRELCKALRQNGIRTEYFGLDEQLQIVREAAERDVDLSPIISSGRHVTELTDFAHKGASIMRNITYLKLSRDIAQHPILHRDNTLIYFIDSDQEFCINSTESENNLYAINYFHYLNEIFESRDISILTGKVVGDPPVSPSVMAGNFQQDVHNFISTIQKLNPDGPCQFHQHQEKNTDDAAYHDMANLFGFSRSKLEFDYHCTLKHSHSNTDCFNDFSEKLSHFFYGEHPTRKTFFSYDDGFTDTRAARTVYTGNYVIRPENLKYFIPFATLKLRMAGPVLGRILKMRLKQKFVSANLPMLHNRTVDSIGQSEYRAGVKNNSAVNNADGKNRGIKDNSQYIDLSNEFIRQFYGDVMLFTIETITNDESTDRAINCETPSAKDLSRESIRSIVDDTYRNIKANYVDKHVTILDLKSRIQRLLENDDNWWNEPSHDNSAIYQQSLENFHDFLENIQSNFDDNTRAYRVITSEHSAKNHLSAITDEIYRYRNDLHNWNEALSQR